MRSVVPCRRDVCKFGEGGGYHDQGCHCTSQRHSGPSHRGGRFKLGPGGINAGRVEGGVVPEEGNVEDPDTVEIDEEVSRRSLLIVGLEEDFVPVDLAELHVPLGGRKVDEPFLLWRLEDWNWRWRG